MPDAVGPQRLARWEDLDVGIPRSLSVNGQRILLVRTTDGLFALSDVCPHNGASLSEGVVKDGCVTCPAHLWRFALADGRRQGSNEVTVATYPVTVDEGGWVVVDVPAPPPPRSLREVLLASARGEEPS